MAVVFHHCPLYRVWWGGEVGLHNRTFTVCMYRFLHVLAFNKELFFIYLQINNQRTRSHTDSASALATGADPITWTHATFPLSVFSSFKESGNPKKLCGGGGGWGGGIHPSNVMYIYWVSVCMLQTGLSLPDLLLCWTNWNYNHIKPLVSGADLL